MTTSSLNGVFQALTVSADLELIKSTEHPPSFAVNYMTRKESSKDVGHWFTRTPESKLYSYRIYNEAGENQYVYRSVIYPLSE